MLVQIFAIITEEMTNKCDYSNNKATGRVATAIMT